MIVRVVISPDKRGRMQEFTARYGDKIQGVLSGFDRLIFRGTLRKIAYECGMKGYLWANRILFKDFGSHAHEVSERVKRAALRCVEEAGRRIQYLPSSKDDKEEIARGIAEQEYITQGPVCALTCVEPEHNQVPRRTANNRAAKVPLDFPQVRTRLRELNAQRRNVASCPFACNV